MINPCTNIQSQITLSELLGENRAIADILINANAKTIAQQLYNKLILFQTSLENNEDIAVAIANFGNTVIIRISQIGYVGDNMVSFLGLDNNNRKVELVQHISQLNVFLMTVEKPPEEQRMKIGFAVPE